jgi:hypothetical protein
MDGARAFAIQKFAVDLLESIDNFDRALSVVPADKLTAEQAEANKELQDLHQGLKMTENILMNTLQKHGLQRFDPGELVDGKAQKFDANRHEATFMAKAADKENGEIMHVQSKGYSLNGRILRVGYSLFLLRISISVTDLIKSRLPRSVSSRTTKSQFSLDFFHRIRFTIHTYDFIKLYNTILSPYRKSPP